MTSYSAGFPVVVYTTLSGHTSVCRTDEYVVITLPDFRVFHFGAGVGSSSTSEPLYEVTRSITGSPLILLVNLALTASEMLTMDG